MRKYLFLGLLICVTGLLPYIVDAQSLVPCTGVADPNDPDAVPCGTCEFAQLIQNVWQFLIAIGSVVVVILLVSLGLMMVTSTGNVSMKDKAKSLLSNVVIGLVLMIAAFAIVDTIMRVLVPSNSSLLNWQDVVCINQRVPQSTGLDSSSSGGIDTGGASYEGAGTCSLAPAGSPCDPDELRPHFGVHAEQMSAICMRESGARPIESRVDLCCGPSGNCDGAPAFSGGYFQINVIANYAHIPGCDGNFFQANGTDRAGIGDCLQRNSSGICTGWSCSITDQTMYDVCMQAVRNDNITYQAASNIFDASEGWYGGFGPWRTGDGNMCQNII